MGVKRDRESAGMSNDAITEDEAALYDRQIRLWGLDCQNRLREAKILIVGLNGLGIEVVKNLTLSGVNAITIMDEKPVSELDFSSQFFAVGAESGQTRAIASKESIQELNPNVKIIIDSEPLSSKQSSFFAEFTAVFLTDCLPSLLVSVNKMCNENKVHFYCGETWGFYGYCFLDLLSHTFSKTEPAKKETEEKKTVLKTYQYCLLEQALTAKVGFGISKRITQVYPLVNIMNNFRENNATCPSPHNRENHLDSLKSIRTETLKDLGCSECKVPDETLSCVFGELSPVCAAVGGVLANEIIKGISGKGEPVHNFFLFDGDSCTGFVENIQGQE